MILVDTSVWIDYFRGRPNAAALVGLLENDEVVCHPWIIGELRLGHLGPRRDHVLADLGRLPLLNISSLQELFEFIERERWYAKGLSWVDTELLYSTLIDDGLLWTHDRTLFQAAQHYHKNFPG